MTVAWRVNAARTMLTDQSGRLSWLLPADGFTVGVTEPTPANTGVAAGSTLSTYTGPTNVDAANGGTYYTISTTGATYRDLIFNYNVRVRGKLNQFYNCQFRGPAAPQAQATFGNQGLVDAAGTAYTDNLFVRCDFIPQAPTVSSYGPVGQGMTTYRCNISGGVVDALNWLGQTSRSIADYLTATEYATDLNQGGGPSHADCIQVRDGYHRIIGSALHGVIKNGVGIYQCIALTPFAGPGIYGIDIVNNWFYGAYTQVSAWPKFGSDVQAYLPNIRVIGNRFDITGVHTETVSGVVNPFNILMTPATQAASTIRGNTRTDGGPVYTKVAANG